jgi:adenine-specific DNA-methyltransferase
VRHHDISSKDKAWYSAQMKQLARLAAQSVGRSSHLFLPQVVSTAKPADVGCFIAAAEWMETNYGASMRGLFCRMGGDFWCAFIPASRSSTTPLRRP